MKVNSNNNFPATRYKLSNIQQSNSNGQDSCRRAIIYNIDSLTKQGLRGAVFSATAPDGSVSTAVSTNNGMLFFCLKPFVKYVLKEETAPAGYILNDREYVICTDTNGRLFVNGNCTVHFCIPSKKMSEQGSFTAIKRDMQTGTPVVGAKFAVLENGITIATAESDTNGYVTFINIPVGEYELIETETPQGYQAGASFAVVVNEDGKITIDGFDADGFILYNMGVFGLDFIKRDERIAPLPGAVFELLQNGEQIATATSNAAGIVDFGNIAPGVYILRELTAPPGYLPNDTEYTVVVSDTGEITVDDIPLAYFTVPNISEPDFVFFKFNEDLVAIQGAEFTLTGADEFVRVARSDINGVVNFEQLAPGNYTLQETVSPSGYLPNPAIYDVVVLNTGEITVEGMPLAMFNVINTPFDDFVFTKTDADETPLEGAEFELRNAMGDVIDTVISDVNGIVNFGALLPGNYTLQETAAPSGYLPNPAIYDVVVLNTGEITVDGMPLEDFTVINICYGNFVFTKIAGRDNMSPAPVINTVIAGNRTVTGTGNEGCEITVVWPNGDESSAEVSASGIWTVNVPEEITLAAGQIVIAIQVCPGYDVSEPVKISVINQN